MRNKTARNLLKILKMIFSSDEETKILGISLIIDHWIITNLNKYESFDIDISYRRDSYHNSVLNLASNKLPISKNLVKFTKSSFIKFLRSSKQDLDYKICAIRNFLLDQTKIENKSTFNREIRYYLINGCKEDFEIEDKCIKNFSYKASDYNRNYVKQIIRDNNISEFVDELYSYGIKSNSGYMGSIRSELKELKFKSVLDYGKNRPGGNRYIKFTWY